MNLCQAGEVLPYILSGTLLLALHSRNAFMAMAVVESFNVWVPQATLYGLWNAFKVVLSPQSDVVKGC